MQVTPRVDMTGTPTKTISTSTTPAPQVEPTAPAADPIDKKLETYAKKEQELRQIHRQMQAEKEAFKKEQEEYKSKYVPKEDFDKTFASPESIMAEMLKRGVTPQQLNEYMLQQPSTMDPAYQQVKALEAKIAQLEANQNRQVEQMSQAQQQQYDQALKQITQDAKALVASDPKSFKTIKGEKAEVAITKLIETTFSKGFPGKYEPGYVMPIEEAAQLVEEHLKDTAKRMAGYLQEEAAPEEKHPILARQPTKTITNQVTPTTKKLSPRDRAVLLMQGKL